MASNSAISISFKVADGENGLKKLTVDAKELHNVMQATVGVSTDLKKNIINFGALATGIDSVSNTLSSWLGTLDGLTQLYSAQIEAETKLAVNMRNTMDAREEDIQSIKDLCSAQQQLGVIGDEVQLAGAQELATYRLEDIFDARSFGSPYTAPRKSIRWRYIQGTSYGHTDRFCLGCFGVRFILPECINRHIGVRPCIVYFKE